VFLCIFRKNSTLLRIVFTIFLRLSNKKGEEMSKPRFSWGSFGIGIAVGLIVGFLMFLVLGNRYEVNFGGPYGMVLTRWDKWTGKPAGTWELWQGKMWQKVETSNVSKAKLPTWAEIKGTEYYKKSGPVERAAIRERWLMVVQKAHGLSDERIDDLKRSIIAKDFGDE
jgi:hypothetical protein